MQSTSPPQVDHHYQIASSPPIYSYLPSCQWAADSHALTWTLLHKLQENPSIKNALWPVAGDYPPCQTKWNASEELAIKVFADHSLFRSYVDADPAYYGRATKGKIWLLKKRYDEVKEKLEIAKKEAATSGREGRRNIRKLWRSIKKQYPYYSLLTAINNDPEMTFESDSELDCKYEFNTPTASSAAPSAYASDAVTPEIRYGAATLRPAGKRLPGKRPPESGRVSMEDEATVVEGSEEEEVEYRSNCEDEGYEDNEGREYDTEDEEIHEAQEEVEYRSNYENESYEDNEGHENGTENEEIHGAQEEMEYHNNYESYEDNEGHENDTEDEEVYEAQEEVQDEIHDQMDTDEELQEELESIHSGIASRESHGEHIVISDSSEAVSSPPQPNRGSNAPEAAKFPPSVSTKRTREDDSSDEVKLERLAEPNELLDHEATYELHRNKVRRRHRFDVKVQERRAEREHERYMIDARVRLAEIRYGIVSRSVGEEK